MYILIIMVLQLKQLKQGRIFVLLGRLALDVVNSPRRVCLLPSRSFGNSVVELTMVEGERSERRLPRSLLDLKRQRESLLERENRPVFVPKKQRLESLERGNDAGCCESASLLSVKAKGGGESTSIGGKPRDSAFRIVGTDETKTSEMEAIKRHYMGESSQRGQRQMANKLGERTRFKFEWDSNDDTSTNDADSDLQELRKSVAEEIRRRMEVCSQVRNGPLRGKAPFPSVRKRPAVSGMRRMSFAGHDDRHWREKSREEMTARDWSIFKEDFSITMRGLKMQSVFPARYWEETDLPPSIMRLIRDVAFYEKPSPIQMAAIPVSVSRRDLIGLAETGSGKTAAFILPLLMHLQGKPAMTARIAVNGPYALVLAPTRELVLQIESEAKKFAIPLGFRVISIIGGQGLEEQGTALQGGCEIVICTPGRMVDLLSRRLAALGNCQFLILDEADRMIDMGFEPQVQEILSAMPRYQHDEKNNAVQFDRERVDMNHSRQTSMFSATMSPSIEKLARDYLIAPVTITVGETGKAADKVEQRVEVLSSDGQKRERLSQLLRTLDPPIIVFANTKHGCEELSRIIESCSSIRPVVLHSGKSQEQREEVLDGFRYGAYKVIVATDVLGRGIDIKGVNHVINYELPKNMDAYTHRIGRTGRAGRKGTAWSLATPADSDMFEALRTYLRQSGAHICAALAKFDGAKAQGLRPIID